MRSDGGRSFLAGRPAHVLDSRSERISLFFRSRRGSPALRADQREIGLNGLPLRATGRTELRGISSFVTWTTSDLYDAHEGDPTIQVLEGSFLALGRRHRFCGPISTLRVLDDNPLVKAALGEPGEGRVLVVDGQASLRAALVGDRLAKMASDHGWAGIVVNGCVRDRVGIDALDIGVRCLGTTPRRSAKEGRGDRDVEVLFAAARFTPGAWLYADEDGILVSPAALEVPAG